jgi:hypothetical protein
MMNFRQIFSPAKLFLHLKNFARRHVFFVYILLSLILLSLFYYPYILNHKTLPSNHLGRRIVDTSLPSQTAHDHFVSPKWEPRFFGGTPSFEKHYASSQIDILDWSISKLLRQISAPQFVYLLLNMVLFSLFIFWASTALGNHPIATFFASLALLFSPFFISLLSYGFHEELLSFFLLPLTFFLSAKLYLKKTAFYFCATAISFGFQLLRAGIYTSYATLLFIGLYLLFDIAFTLFTKKRAKTAVVSSLFVLCALMTGIFLSSVLLVPLLDESRFITQSIFSTSPAISSSVADMFSLFSPLAGNMPFFSGTDSASISFYFQVTLLVLAGTGIIFARDKMTGFLFASTVVFCLIANGHYIPFFRSLLPFFVPFYKNLESPSLFYGVFYFSLALLAGKGASCLLSFYDTNKRITNKRLVEKRTYRFFIGLLLLAVIIPLFVIFAKSHIIRPFVPEDTVFNVHQQRTIFFNLLFDALKFLLLVALSVFFVFYYMQKKMSYALMISALTAMMFLDLAVIDYKLLSRKVHQVPPVTIDQEDMAILEKDESLFRFFYLSGGEDRMPFPSRNWQNLTGPAIGKLKLYQDFLQETGFDHYQSYLIHPFLAKYWRLVLRSHQEVWQPVPIQQIEPSRLNFDYAILDMLNVKYIFSEKFAINDPRYNLVNDSRPWLYENTTVLPRAFWADSVVVLTGRRRIFSHMRSAEFEPGKLAIIEETPPFAIDKADSADVQITSYRADEIRLKAFTSHPALLVLSENYYPSGWKAFVNGQESKIYKTNYLLRSLFLQPGNYKIVFRFYPKAFTIGAWMSFAAATLVLSLLITIIYIHVRDYFTKRGTDSVG